MTVQVSKISPAILLIFMLVFQQLVVGSEAVNVGFSLLPDSTLISSPDSATSDSLNNQTIAFADTNVANDNSLKSKVKYHAKDSIRVNIEDQITYLYGNATVDYEELHLEAERITIDMSKKELFAEGVKDSTGKEYGTPNFSQGDQKFKSNNIHYNFSTKKGKIGYVITQEGQGYIHGDVVKKDPENNFFIKHGQYTTCDLDTPHFAITSNKLKVISKNKIVTGPAYLTVEQIPTPILIPFGFFPNKPGRSSGIIIPTFGESTDRGFYFQHMGYYLGINDYVDAELTTDLYTKGSYTIDLQSQYRKRYKYSGRVFLSYAYSVVSEKELPDYNVTKDFKINWTHASDQKAHPNSTFSAQVNAGSNNYYQNTISSLNNFLTNTFQSSINYSYVFPNKPMNLSASVSHSQNTISHDVHVTVPDLSYNISRINPFKRKISGGQQKWYEKIGTSIALKTTNYIDTKDSLLFNEDIASKLKNGMQISAPISTSFNILKYFNFSPSISLTERLYLKTTQYEWNDAGKKIDTLTVNKPATAYDYSVSAGLSTRIYGMYQFLRGPVSAIRHVMTPSVAFTYRPDFGQAKFGYYKTLIVDTTGRTRQYSIFQNSVYGGPSAGKFGNISFGLDNNLEMKVRTNSDTGEVFKKIKLLESFRISGDYNLMADSMKLGTFALAARTTLFDKVSINYSAGLDPYAYDTSNIDYDRYQYDVNNHLLRVTHQSISANFSLNNTTPKENINGKFNQDELDYINSHPEEYIDFNVPYNLSVSYSLDQRKTGGLPTKTSQSASFSGDLSLTKSWKITFNSWYNITEGKFTSFSTSIYRDLHCWEMRFYWVPFGGQETYNFQINVKASILQDLKLIKKKDFYDR